MYGWPLVVVQDSRGIARVAPLLITELSLPTKMQPDVGLADEPTLNAALVAADYFDPVDVACAFEMAGMSDGQPTVGQP